MFTLLDLNPPDLSIQVSQSYTLFGITLNCQPQNCLLVDNPEVGNSEYIHYSYHAIVVDAGTKKIHLVDAGTKQKPCRYAGPTSVLATS